MHQLGSTTPVEGHCTRYVALHPIRTGVMPTDRVHGPTTASANAELSRGFNPIGRIQPHREDSTRSEEVELAWSGFVDRVF